MTYDLVIRGAKVYDGTGAPYFYSNIGIKDGIIARMTRLPLEGERVIDAAGLSVCPGFIDP
ncbi:MAG: aminoacylase, partial [Clostridia bacterium]|nr:aminoacylase [Clostridia bacterium]